jgi:hypothetical protein
MSIWASKPIVHLARVVRSALLERRYFKRQDINAFCLGEKVLEIATYSEKEALIVIKVLITASFISFEWTILAMIFDPMPSLVTDVHVVEYR